MMTNVYGKWLSHVDIKIEALLQMYHRSEKEIRKELEIFSVNKKIGNGKKTLFLKDWWISKNSLQNLYPLLFELASDSKNSSVSSYRI
jgi:hypothetical protein